MYQLLSPKKDTDEKRNSGILEQENNDGNNRYVPSKKAVGAHLFIS